MKRNSFLKKFKKAGVWGYNVQGATDGFGYAGYQLTKTMNKLGVETVWQDLQAPIALSFTQPRDYGGNKNQYLVGYTPWESTKVPDFWNVMMNTRDLIWTTSNACKEWYQNDGVMPNIEVVPHGIDPNEWPLIERNLDGPFTFVHMGEPADRKNGQMVFDAYRKVFSRKKDVNLLFKANGHIEARW